MHVMAVDGVILSELPTSLLLLCLDAFEIRRLSSVFLRVRTNVGVRVLYDREGLRLYLQVDQRWVEDTVGLCGTFNGQVHRLDNNFYLMLLLDLLCDLLQGWLGAAYDNEVVANLGQLLGIATTNTGRSACNECELTSSLDSSLSAHR